MVKVRLRMSELLRRISLGTWSVPIPKWDKERERKVIMKKLKEGVKKKAARKLAKMPGNYTRYISKKKYEKYKTGDWYKDYEAEPKIIHVQKWIKDWDVENDRIPRLKKEEEINCISYEDLLTVYVPYEDLDKAYDSEEELIEPPSFKEKVVHIHEIRKEQRVVDGERREFLTEAESERTLACRKIKLPCEEIEDLFEEILEKLIQQMWDKVIFTLDEQVNIYRTGIIPEHMKKKPEEKKVTVKKIDPFPITLKIIDEHIEKISELLDPEVAVLNTVKRLIEVVEEPDIVALETIDDLITNVQELEIEINETVKQLIIDVKKYVKFLEEFIDEGEKVYVRKCIRDLINTKGWTNRLLWHNKRIEKEETIENWLIRTKGSILNDKLPVDHEFYFFPNKEHVLRLRIHKEWRQYVKDVPYIFIPKPIEERRDEVKEKDMLSKKADFFLKRYHTEYMKDKSDLIRCPYCKREFKFCERVYYYTSFMKCDCFIQTEPKYIHPNWSYLDYLYELPIQPFEQKAVGTVINANYFDIWAIPELIKKQDPNVKFLKSNIEKKMVIEDEINNKSETFENESDHVTHTVSDLEYEEINLERPTSAITPQIPSLKNVEHSRFVENVPVRANSCTAVITMEPAKLNDSVRDVRSHSTGVRSKVRPVYIERTAFSTIDELNRKSVASQRYDGRMREVEINSGNEKLLKTIEASPDITAETPIYLGKPKWCKYTRKRDKYKRIVKVKKPKELEEVRAQKEMQDLRNFYRENGKNFSENLKFNVLGGKVTYKLKDHVLEVF